MSWAAKYVGIPQRDRGRDETGADCWGLLRLVYAQELGISLPSCADDYFCAAETAELARLIEAGREDGPWHPITEPRAFDALLFRAGRYASHIAIAIDARRMLHIYGRDCAKVEDRMNPRWRNRFVGAWRHEARS